MKNNRFYALGIIAVAVIIGLAWAWVVPSNGGEAKWPSVWPMGKWSNGSKWIYLDSDGGAGGVAVLGYSNYSGEGDYYKLKSFGGDGKNGSFKVIQYEWDNFNAEVGAEIIVTYSFDGSDLTLNGMPGNDGRDGTYKHE